MHWSYVFLALSHRYKHTTGDGDMGEYFQELSVVINFDPSGTEPGIFGELSQWQFNWTGL